MRRVGLTILVLATVGCALRCDIAAGEVAFRYPVHMVDMYDPDNNCWEGMAPGDIWPMPVDPRRWLIAAPPSVDTGVSLPRDHWVEVMFRGRITDGVGADIKLIESGKQGETALVFLTELSGREYLLGRVQAINDPANNPKETYIDIDISGHDPGFIPEGIRLVSVDDGGGSPGFDVMNFRARIETVRHEQASGPVPPDGADEVDPWASLEWLEGMSTTGHLVYLGTSLDDVSPRATPVTGNWDPLDANTYDPCGLEMGRRYFWRVDEEDSFGTVHRGKIWTFETMDQVVLDDFEFYVSSLNPITNTWKPYRYSYVWISENPNYRCRRSMLLEYMYYGEYNYGEAMVTFESPQDWGAIGARSVDVVFRGTAGNDDTGEMYFFVGDDVNGTAIPYDGDGGDVGLEQWRTWRINLDDVVGVNMNKVHAYGVGYRNVDPRLTGDMTLYFDDIVLYPRRCLPEDRPVGDFDGDCLIDFLDADEVASGWLDEGENTYPAARPRSPVARYEFDGNADDSVGGFHGTIAGDVNFVDGKYGQAAVFDGQGDSVVISDAAGLFDQIGDAITIAFWHNGDDSPHHLDTICCSNYNYGAMRPAVSINVGCWISPGRYNWDCGYPWTPQGRLSGDHKYKSEWAGRWNHWAFVKDAAAETGGVMRIYLNGRLYASQGGSTTPISGISSFQIGSGWYGGFDGLLDDFRIYDYALSAAEVAYAATEGDGRFEQDLISPADVTGDRRIDFGDLSVLLDDWLVDRLWP